MDVAFQPKDQVWRRRGRPPRQVSPEIIEIAQRSYNTGQCAEVTLTEDDTEQDVRDLINMLTSYARSVGKRILDQREGDVLRITMVDVKRRATRKVSA